MADYYTQFSTELECGTAENAQAALELYEEERDAFERGEGDGLDFTAVIERSHPTRLWIYADESGSASHVAEFVSAVGQKFGLTGRFSMQYAETCSRPRLDGFGGGAVLVDFDSGQIEWLNTSDWLAEKLAPAATS